MPLDTIDGAVLHDYVERVAAIMIRHKQDAGNIAEICSEADEAGVCSKRELRKLAREALMDQDVLQAQLQRMQELRDALGDYGSTPLGDAAVHRQPPQSPWPIAFAEQPVHQPKRRGRPRKVM